MDDGETEVRRADDDAELLQADLGRAVRTGRIVPYKLDSPQWRHLASLVDGSPADYVRLVWRGRTAVLGLRHGLLFYEE